jgi:hypothetical protein
MTMTDSEHSPRTLSGALRAVAEEDSGLGASPAVEVALREAVRAMGHTERGRVSPMFLAAAAALSVIVVGSWRLVAVHAPDRVLATREIATAFFPLTYGDLPVMHGHIVRLDVPRSALRAFGLGSIDVPAADTETVEADVLVGPDGLARAVRFVHYVKSEE